MNHIISINSQDAKFKKNTAGAFICSLPDTMYNVTDIALIQGNIPYTTEFVLYYVINEISDRRVQNINSNRGSMMYNGILRWDTTVGYSTNSRIALPKLNKLCNYTSLETPILRMERLTFSFYNEDGEPTDFGADNIPISFITPSVSPTHITTTIPHTLNNGDYVYIRDIDNMSTIALNKNINSKWLITKINNSEISIVIDTSSESANQILTSEDSASYDLGSHAVVKSLTDERFQVVNVTAGAPGTVVLLSRYHNFNINDCITITGMDNGATFEDNSAINSKHYITAVPNNLSITISPVISSYATPATKTGLGSPYLLGSRGYIKIVKKQVSLDLMIRTTGVQNSLQKKISGSLEMDKKNAYSY